MVLYYFGSSEFKAQSHGGIRNSWMCQILPAKSQAGCFSCGARTGLGAASEFFRPPFPPHSLGFYTQIWVTGLHHNFRSDTVTVCSDYRFICKSQPTDLFMNSGFQKTWVPTPTCVLGRGLDLEMIEWAGFSAPMCLQFLYCFI